MQQVTEEDMIAGTASELSSLVSIAKPPDREYSNLLNITVRMADPNLAANTANAIADVYMSLVFENEIENARKNQQFLTERLGILRDDLRIAEQRLQDYREAENIVSRSSGPDEIDEELSSLSNRYFEARENRLRQENLYQQIRNVTPSSDRWMKIPAITNHPRISALQADLQRLNQRKSELSKRYGSRHNRMIALESEINATISAMRNRVGDVIDGIRSEYELARKIEAAAEETLSSTRSRAQQLGRKEYQLNELVQDVEAKREVYAVFLERLNQDGASGPVRNDNLWVADPAVVPNAGQRTSLMRAAIVALILSGGLAVGIGLFFELTNNTLLSGEDVERKLGMPLVGYLPLIAGHAEDEEGLTYAEYIHNPESRFSEALRTTRTSLTLTTLEDTDTRKYVVTSAHPHEGKTSVALSLAAAFGQTSKVLVIDGDLRKPSLERILNTSNHKLPGLSDVIAESVTLDEAIHRRDDAEIDVLFAGSRTLRPLELLASQQFSDLMRELEERYDTIIIDSPPCISVSDAYVLATHVSAVLFVAKGGTTPVPVIRSALSRFSNTESPIAGVLLNQIDFDAAYNQGKYQEYYDYHGYTEKPAEAAAS